jgi:hypothetical protein
VHCCQHPPQKGSINSQFNREKVRLDETYRDIPAGTKVLDVGVIVFGIDASGRSWFAEAAHAVELTIGIPSFVLIAADLLNSKLISSKLKGDFVFK